MISFFLKLKKPFIVLLNAIIILGSSYCIFQAENFQKKLSPKKFWTTKVKRLKKELKKDSLKIQALELDLEKEKLLCSYNQKQAKIKAQQLEENENIAVSEVEKGHKLKLNNMEKQLEELKAEKGKIEMDLKEAASQVDVID